MKMNSTLKKLSPYQGTLGLIAIGLGIWFTVETMLFFHLDSARGRERPRSKSKRARRPERGAASLFVADPIRLRVTGDGPSGPAGERQSATLAMIVGYWGGDDERRSA